MKRASGLFEQGRGGGPKRAVRHRGDLGTPNGGPPKTPPSSSETCSAGPLLEDEPEWADGGWVEPGRGRS